MPSTPRAVIAVLAWAAAVGAATVVGLTAVGAIGVGIVGSGSRPLDAAEVERLLATTVAPPLPGTVVPSSTPVAGTTSGPPVPGTVAPPPVPLATAPIVVAGPGGTVLARCTDDVVQVVSASPAQGFRVDDEQRGDPARVRFEAESTEVEMRISCVDGRPVSETRVDE